MTPIANFLPVAVDVLPQTKGVQFVDSDSDENDRMPKKRKVDSLVIESLELGVAERALGEESASHCLILSPISPFNSSTPLSLERPFQATLVGPS
jgi:hypothetical protein